MRISKKEPKAAAPLPTQKIDRYDHQGIETKWQRVWEEKKLNYLDLARARKPFYNLMMFPYPSAEGLHVGNMYAFTGSDIYGRFKRMQGYDVFEPIGLDGFGIHSENYALKVGRHPMDHARITQKNFYRQLGVIGCMYDWSRTVETYDPSYYRWTQWLFVQMFKHGLAYRGKAQVNFCPSCKTVLADEQVIRKRSAEVGAHFAAHPSNPEVHPPSPGSGKDMTVLKSVHLPALAEKGEIDFCERCGNTVIKKLLEQWFFKITAYAEKLLQNSFSLDWSEKVRVAQQQWIGKKEGINISYKVKDSDIEIVCFTTTPVNFAATFIVLSPEHSAVLKVTQKDRLSDIKSYIEKTKKISPEQRVFQGREKTGVFTGSYCINHVTGEKIPIWVSDFVIMSVGTGAIQGCPGHDMRDFEFAKKFGLPIKRVVVGPDGDKSPIERPQQVIQAGQPGTMIHSEFLDGLSYREAMEKTKDYFEKKGWGNRVVSYHLRDWLISRQRYWGSPIPMIFCQHCADQGRSWFITEEAKKYHVSSIKYQGKDKIKDHNTKYFDHNTEMAGWYAVNELELPVLLPRIDDYKPGDDGIAPLAKHKEFYETTCPGCGGKAVRETDVSDTFLDSSWYFLRYPSVSIDGDRAEVDRSNSRVLPFGKLRASVSVTEGFTPSVARGSNLSDLPARSNPQLPWDPAITKKWLPVDMYTGGAEHSVLHLMYSRFVWMALRDWGYLDFSGKAGSRSAGDEPFSKFYAHGLVIKDGAKMSKSKGNVVNPDEYIERYGADALRLYLMFTGPYDQGGDFRDSAMEGMARWVGRVWRMAIASMINVDVFHPRGGGIAANGGKGHLGGESSVKRALHKLVKKVGDDIEKRRYNTAIAGMMEFTNLVGDEGGFLRKEELKSFILLLAPFAPYITEELWSEVNNISESSFIKTNSIHLQPWPSYDESAFIEDVVTIVVQVNGKVRDKLEVQSEQGKIQSEVESLARGSEKVKRFLQDKKIAKVVFVPGKLINFVTT